MMMWTGPGVLLVSSHALLLLLLLLLLLSISFAFALLASSLWSSRSELAIQGRCCGSCFDFICSSYFLLGLSCAYTICLLYRRHIGFVPSQRHIHLGYIFMAVDVNVVLVVNKYTHAATFSPPPPYNYYTRCLFSSTFFFSGFKHKSNQSFNNFILSFVFSQFNLQNFTYEMFSSPPAN
ncbi:hypothetical protein L2E82_22774 [Cichorium intybus]|uniref:Uncharacterized protein n=1 Tax=Cichorium intybus TaxID=13427 RepID=A0ACB9DZC7_CICIN|nr:hypothetical protein L2E82_22774 [Cichorium intybus]